LYFQICKPLDYSPESFLISFSLLSASMGVRLLISRPAI
jgi:hypothetical protein